MTMKPWRERVADEEKLLERLASETSAAAKRRADALQDGIAELGSTAEVARVLGRSWNAVYNAIQRSQRAAGPVADSGGGAADGTSTGDLVPGGEVGG